MTANEVPKPEQMSAVAPGEVGPAQVEWVIDDFGAVDPSWDDEERTFYLL
jgi:hypothetical protein